MKTCGNCDLYGANVYKRPNKTCCIDIVLDLPASLSATRTNMEPHQGEGCSYFRPVELTPAGDR